MAEHDIDLFGGIATPFDEFGLSQSEHPLDGVSELVFSEMAAFRPTHEIELFKFTVDADEEGNDPPAITFVTPVSEITKDQPIVVDVYDDNNAYRRIILMVTFFESGQGDWIHDGDSFSPFYIANSTRSVIPGGFRYTLRRSGGWPQKVGKTTLMKWRVLAIDTEGNEG
jgi:hypothetical protein